MHRKDMPVSQKLLVVDSSRVVRASLAKHLRERFEVLEESGGESAWQSLVLDPSITAVISGLDIATLEGASLIERLRASKLARLNKLPFFLLVSDSFAALAKNRALQLGVSDFILKGTTAKAIKHIFDCLKEPGGVDIAQDAGKASAGKSQSGPDIPEDQGQSDIGFGDFVSRIDRMVGLTNQVAAKDSSEQPAVIERDDHHPAGARSEQCLQELLSSTVGSEPVGVLVFGLDAYDDLKSRYGQAAADKVVMKFSCLLSGKIREEDRIGQLADGRIAIVSPTAGREQCASFAWRVCRALAAAHISVQGQRVETTVSAGLAGKPEDSAAASTEELLRLAMSRLDGAIRAGGNRVVYTSGCGGNNVDQDEFIARLRDLLANVAPDTVLSCKGWVTSVCVACRQSVKAGKTSACPSGAGGTCLAKVDEGSL